MDMEYEPEMVSLAAYESLSSRFTRIIKYMVLGWAASVIALGLVLVIAIGYSEEVVTETTTSEVMQDADNSGSNVYSGGDYYGYADSTGEESNDGEASAQGAGGAAE